jgi:hypothetical protein
MKLDERLARGWRVMDWGIFLRELLLLTVSPRVAGWQTMACGKHRDRRHPLLIDMKRKPDYLL